MKSPPYDCSLIIPTYNRREILAETLSRIESLPDDRYEVIVVDNGSTDGTATLHRRHPRVRWIELGDNLGAAARNVAATAARGRTLLMLDDDSWPAEGTVSSIVDLFDGDPELGAAACRVRLADPPHRHDAGGVPGVFFNCGGAIRREAFLEVGGFPIDFDYYVEEYDVCCRLLQRGWRVEPHGDLLVWHRRVATNRDNNRMLRLLVRNNLRLWQHYAPDDELDDLKAATVERYRRVAEHENALDGFYAGLEEAGAETADRGPRRRPLSTEQLACLFGLNGARRVLLQWADNHQVKKAAIWTRGKGCEQLLKVLRQARISIEAVYDREAKGELWLDVCVRSENQFEPRAVDGIVVGTLSPGVAEDLREELRDRYEGVPVLSVVPWVTQQTPQLAVPV